MGLREHILEQGYPCILSLRVKLLQDVSTCRCLLYEPIPDDIYLPVAKNCVAHQFVCEALVVVCVTDTANVHRLMHITMKYVGRPVTTQDKEEVAIHKLLCVGSKVLWGGQLAKEGGTQLQIIALAFPRKHVILEHREDDIELFCSRCDTMPKPFHRAISVCLGLMIILYMPS